MEDWHDHTIKQTKINRGLYGRLTWSHNQTNKNKSKALLKIDMITQSNQQK